MHPRRPSTASSHFPSEVLQPSADLFFPLSSLHAACLAQEQKRIKKMTSGLPYLSLTRPRSPDQAPPQPPRCPVSVQAPSPSAITWNRFFPPRCGPGGSLQMGLAGAVQGGRVNSLPPGELQRGGEFPDSQMEGQVRPARGGDFSPHQLPTCPAGSVDPLLLRSCPRATHQDRPCAPAQALPLVSLPALLPGYSEDGGALRGEVIPEHEFATGPVCLEDENEFPPVSIRSP